MPGGGQSFGLKLWAKSFQRIWPPILALLVAVTPAASDPLGLVDYDALMSAQPDRTFCTGGTFCTVVLPGGGVVQQDASGEWLAGGTDLTAGSFVLGFGLILAIFDSCGRFLEGIDEAVFDTALTEVKAHYGRSLAIEGLGQAIPSRDAIDAAFAELRAGLSGYVEADPDLSRCIVPGALATLLVEMAQESYWGPELTRLSENPTLPTANFRIE